MENERIVNNLRDKLNGYRPTHKNKWLLIKHKVLSLQESSLLEFYADIFDFDKRHKTFGLFKVDFEQIANMFNCKSENTIRNWHNKLLKLGFIKKTNVRDAFVLVCHLRYVASGIKWGGEATEYKTLEMNQPIEVILKSFGINNQNIGQNTQNIGQKDVELASIRSPKGIVSSKNNLSIVSNKNVKGKVRTDEEYKQIYSEGNSPSIDDMEWIDQNVTSIYDGNGEKETEY